MAYAGICGAENLQPHSDAYFHRRSLDQIETYSRTGNGDTCKAVVAQSNAQPVADAGADYTIPISTPFALTGSATDGNGGVLDYCWEQWDLGPAGPAISGDAPIFRSFDPGAGPAPDVSQGGGPRRRHADDRRDPSHLRPHHALPVDGARQPAPGGRGGVRPDRDHGERRGRPVPCHRAEHGGGLERPRTAHA